MWHWLTTSTPVTFSPLSVAVTMGIAWWVVSMWTHRVARALQDEVSRLEGRIEELRRLDR